MWNSNRIRPPLVSVVLLAAGLLAPTQAQAWQTDGWSEEGLERVEDELDRLGTAAFVLVTDGRTIMSHGRVDQPFRMHSIRKSLLSALIGIAASEGEMNLEATLGSLGINDKGLLTPREEAATVRHLLASRSGIYHPAASETDEARDERPSRGSHEPGNHWYYNNWDFNALGTIYGSARGQTVGDAFRDRIAIPIAMQDFDVDRDFEYHHEPHLSRHPSYRFRLSARDLVRFGSLFLNQGEWNGRQLVPTDWVSRSTSTITPLDSEGTKGGYGLMWWTTGPNDSSLPAGSYTASGAGGQRLTVLPSIGSVVVHLMDTDGEARIGTGRYDALLRLLMLARVDAGPGR